MFVYITTFVSSSVLSFSYSLSKDKSARIVFWILTFLSLFIPAALRYGIGVDYFNYIRIYYDIFKGYDVRQEVGIIFISKILQFFHLPGHALIVTYSFLTILFIFLSIPKRYFFLVIPVYVLYFYLDSYCLLRQALACAMMLYAIRFFLRGKKVSFIFWCIIAILNHKVAIIPTILIILFQILPKSRGQIYTTIYVILFFALFFFRNALVDFIMSVIVPQTPFSHYAENRYADAQAEVNTGLGFLLRYVCLGVLLYLICSSKMQKKEKSFAIGSIFYMLFSAHLSSVLYIFVRLVNSYSFVLAYLIYFAWRSQSRFRKSFLLFFFFGSFLLFIAGIYGTPITGKAMNGKQIYPYISIFNKYENSIVHKRSLLVSTTQY